MAGRKKEEPKGADFMTSWADLLTVLFAFFAMMFATSNTDTEKFQEFLESFNAAILGETGETKVEDYIQIVAPETGDSMEQEEELNGGGNPIESLEELYAALQEYIKESNLEGKVESTINDNNVEVVVVDDLLFDVGEAIIKPEAEQVIYQLGYFLADMDNEILIEGHTDSRPISTAAFPSNWELSASRSINIVHYLIDNFNLDPERLTAIGYADTKPVAVNDSEENMKKNRRVVIKINE